METFSAITFLVVIVGLVAILAVASIAWGADSRPGLGDDHAR